MEPRIDLLASEIGAKIAKRIAGVSLVITQSTLPKATQDLVMLRASQINGCGFCVDIHSKEAAAAGEATVRINDERREGRQPPLALLRDIQDFDGAVAVVGDVCLAPVGQHRDARRSLPDPDLGDDAAGR